MSYLFVLVGMFLIAYLGHEAGHLVVAHLRGWSVVRVAFHPLGGIGFAYEMNGRGGLLPVTAAGPALNALFALAALAFMPGLYAWTFFVVNAVLGGVQLLPIPGSDGWLLLGALRSRA